jgi:hypothetical protein
MINKAHTPRSFGRSTSNRVSNLHTRCLLLNSAGRSSVSEYRREYL